MNEQGSRAPFCPSASVSQTSPLPKIELTGVLVHVLAHKGLMVQHTWTPLWYQSPDTWAGSKERKGQGVIWYRGLIVTEWGWSSEITLNTNLSKTGLHTSVTLDTHYHLKIIMSEVKSIYCPTITFYNHQYIHLSYRYLLILELYSFIVFLTEPKKVERTMHVTVV